MLSRDFSIGPEHISVQHQVRDLAPDGRNSVRADLLVQDEQEGSDPVHRAQRGADPGFEPRHRVLEEAFQGNSSESVSRRRFLCRDSNLCWTGHETTALTT